MERKIVSTNQRVKKEHPTWKQITVLIEPEFLAELMQETVNRGLLSIVDVTYGRCLEVALSAWLKDR